MGCVTKLMICEDCGRYIVAGKSHTCPKANVNQYGKICQACGDFVRVGHGHLCRPANLVAWEDLNPKAQESPPDARPVLCTRCGNEPPVYWSQIAPQGGHGVTSMMTWLNSIDVLYDVALCGRCAHWMLTSLLIDIEDKEGPMEPLTILAYVKQIGKPAEAR
jgi:hypothetical protein